MAVELLDLSTRRIAVTGGAGFLGGHVLAALADHGVADAIAVRREAYDLRDKAACRRLYEELAPDVVIHLAATVGGIGANLENPGRFLYENLVMGAELVEEGRRYGRLERFVGVGTVCAYPAHTPVPFREDALWDGYPEPTNAPYGLAKRLLIAQLQAYRRQYGLRGIALLPANLYGPGDDFDPATSHVIPAIIRKVDDAQTAGTGQIALWGDGSPTREFLHVRDAARGIVMATARYDAPEPVNLGTGAEISIAELAQSIARLMGFDGEIRWQPDRPGGQRRRRLDTRRARERFGFEARIPLEEGLRETIDWWCAQRG